MSECLYCNAELTADQDAPVPAISDDEGWGLLAEEHHAGCEWIATRAHRVEAD